MGLAHLRVWASRRYSTTLGKNACVTIEFYLSHALHLDLFLYLTHIVLLLWNSILPKQCNPIIEWASKRTGNLLLLSLNKGDRPLALEPLLWTIVLNQSWGLPCESDGSDSHQIPARSSWRSDFWFRSRRKPISLRCCSDSAPVRFQFASEPHSINVRFWG